MNVTLDSLHLSVVRPFALRRHEISPFLAAMKEASIDELIVHCRAVADVIPVVGFYLQTAVGGQALPYAFWRRFAEIENVVAIKMAPFNRYRTLDVVRAVIDARAEDRIADGRSGPRHLDAGHDALAAGWAADTDVA